MGFIKKKARKVCFSFNLIFILMFFLLSLHAEYFYEKLI